jgi:hypothetical protein
VNDPTEVIAELMAKHKGDFDLEILDDTVTSLMDKLEISLP